jgi:hypothetical protein
MQIFHIKFLYGFVIFNWFCGYCILSKQGVVFQEQLKVSREQEHAEI